MDIQLAKAIASIAVCGAGACSMWATKDKKYPTGIGWTILGLYFIWVS